MSDVIEVSTEAELSTLISENDVVVVDFAAPAWCVPCQRLAPHYEAVASNVTEAKFIHVDIDTCDPELVRSWTILSVPTVKLFKAGRYVRTLNKSEFNAPRLTSAVSELL